MNETTGLTPKQPARRATIARMATAITVAAMPILASPARAHTDKAHGPTTGRARREQKDWGIAGDARNARRSIEVVMADDMRFTPARIEIRLGETVKFVVRNTGKVMHEFVIGTKAENVQHAAMMVKFPTMAHDEPYMTHVPPGKSGEIVWTFNRAGDFEFACLIAGHYQGGMAGTITVRAGTG